MKVLSFGSCNIDYVYKVAHIVKPGETISSLNRECFPGGKGLNQSISMARSGIRVYHAGCIGEEGLFLKDVMEASGVNTTLMRVADVPSGHAIIQVDENGENSIVLFSGANHLNDRAYIDEVLAKFEERDIIVLQNEISNIDYIVERAHEKKMQIVLNPSPFYDNLKHLDLNKINILIMNEIEASEFCGSTELEKILEYFRTNFKELKVVLTLGAKGSAYFDSETEEFCPSFCVKAVDTTSAGDTFTGYFISNIKKGYSVKKALRTASAAAALAVSRKGASSSIPYINEVDEALKTLKPNKQHDLESERQKELVLQYMESHLADARLDGIAQILGYSRTYTATWIKKSTGKSFSALLKEQRCKRAARLLKETDMSVQEIIIQCGYENGSFFREIFYKEFGKTPLEYRKFYEMKL